MLVSVSTMPAKNDYLNYAKQIENFADFLHLDVCDGKYNKRKCFSPKDAKNVNMHSTLPLDCHLMTKNPTELAKEYINAGVNIVTAQIETFENEKETREFINFVKSNNTLVGLSIEPKTDIQKIMPYIKELDLVLVMSVKTGKSGQSFDMSVVNKIGYLENVRKEYKYTYKIEVDGGINYEYANLVSSFGADIVVSGSYVFSAENKQKAIEKLKKA